MIELIAKRVGRWRAGPGRLGLRGNSTESYLMVLAAIQMLAKTVILDIKMAVTVNTPKNKSALLWLDFRGTGRFLCWLEKCKNCLSTIG